MNLLITGGNSFLSRHVFQILKPNYDVYITGRTRPDYLTDSDKFISFQDLFDSGISFFAIIHIAAMVDTNSNSWKKDELYEANVAYTKKLIDSLTAIKSFKRFVYVSSVSVYSPNTTETITNHNPIGKDIIYYGKTKVWAENYIRKKIKNHLIFRFSSIYGEYMKEDSIIPRYVNQSLSEDQIIVWGNGQRLQNYIHVKDAAKLLSLAVHSNKNGTYLATDSREYSNLDLAQIICDNRNCKIIFKNEDSSPSMTYDNNCTKDTFKWSTEIEFKTGVQNYINWKVKQF
jgi:nucleoside-diphosphate-sugar epimerase